MTVQRTSLAERPPVLWHNRGVSGPEADLQTLVGRAVLRVTASGVLTTCLPANEDCLGWALSQYLQAGSPLRINPLTLAEYTLEYFRLLDLQVAPLFDARWRTRVIARGMKTHLVVLEPEVRHGRGIPMTPPSLEHLAHSDEWLAESDAEGDAERDAYHALLRVYALFDLSDSHVPFTQDQRVVSSIIEQQ
jgi:hypothetical protein